MCHICAQRGRLQGWSGRAILGGDRVIDRGAGERGHGAARGSYRSVLRAADSAEELTLAPSRWYLTGFLAPKAD